MIEPQGEYSQKNSVGVCGRPYPIYDQNLRFSLPYFWPHQNFDTLYMIVAADTVALNIIFEGLLFINNRPQGWYYVKNVSRHQSNMTRTWLWRWLPLRLSKHQSPTTVLFRTTFTRTITLYELLILLGSNHLRCYRNYYRRLLFLTTQNGSKLKSRKCDIELSTFLSLRTSHIKRWRSYDIPWSLLLRNIHCVML